MLEQLGARAIHEVGSVIRITTRFSDSSDSVRIRAKAMLDNYGQSALLAGRKTIPNANPYEAMTWRDDARIIHAIPATIINKGDDMLIVAIREDRSFDGSIEPQIRVARIGEQKVEEVLEISTEQGQLAVANNVGKVDINKKPMLQELREDPDGWINNVLDLVTGILDQEQAA